MFVLLTVHHGTLMNHHQLGTLFLVCLLGVSASTCFGRYSPIFRRLCTDAVWCNYVRRMCVDYMHHGDVTIHPIWTSFKRTLLQRSLPNVTCVIPVAVNYSHCTPDDGYGKYPKHVE
jgi:hypothetical protein